jgi:hypothetical protein
MREDMFKIIVERPRHGWRDAPRARNRLSGEDDLPTKIGMRRHVAVTRIKSKSLNENLNPLRRYLGRQVGRLWNDVYSEISATLAPGHTVKEHVRQHIDDFVVRKITIDASGTWVAATNKWYGPKAAPWRQPYYVDPIDGVLKDSAQRWKMMGVDPKPWRRREPEPDPDVRFVDPMHEFRRIDGVWYEITYHREPGTDELIYDLVRRVLVRKHTRHAVAKRQLARPELRYLGLVNK